MDLRVIPTKPQPSIKAPDIAVALSLDSKGHAKPRRGRWRKWALVVLLVARSAGDYYYWQQNDVVKVT